MAGVDGSFPPEDRFDLRGFAAAASSSASVRPDREAFFRLAGARSGLLSCGIPNPEASSAAALFVCCFFDRTREN